MPQVEPTSRSEPALRRRVLVVDDYKETAGTMAKLLTMMGHEVCTAHDGPEAIESASAFRPDVVLLDIGLPKMSGYDVARRIRKDLGENVFLIALSGWAQEDDQRRAREAGFNEHLIKPIKVDYLESLLCRPRQPREG